MIDQTKIGGFLRTLRKEKGLTQEKLAEQMGVTNRSVSRWETGSNLPDLAVLIDLAAFYDVDLTELLNGERNGTEMNKETETALRKAADYSAYDRERLTRRMHWCFMLGAVGFIVFLVLELMGLADAGWTEDIASFSLGIAFGIILMGCLYTSKWYPNIWRAKRRLLHRDTERE